MTTKLNPIADMIDRLAVLKQELKSVEHLQKEHDDILKTLREMVNENIVDDIVSLESDNYILEFSAPSKMNILNDSLETFIKSTGLYECCTVSISEAKKKLKKDFDKHFHIVLGSRKLTSLNRK
jgi:coenzyme F420-reducing hydrogenase delta subunit